MAAEILIGGCRRRERRYRSRRRSLALILVARRFIGLVANVGEGESWDGFFSGHLAQITIAALVRLSSVDSIMFLDYVLLQVLVGGEGGARAVATFERPFGHISGREIRYKAVAGRTSGVVGWHGGHVAANRGDSTRTDGGRRRNGAGRTDDGGGGRLLLLLDRGQLRTVLAQEMAVAVRLGGEQKRAVGALVRLLAGVGERVATQRRSPRERARTEVAMDAIRRRRVRALLLLLGAVSVRLVDFGVGIGGSSLTHKKKNKRESVY